MFIPGEKYEFFCFFFSKKKVRSRTHGTDISVPMVKFICLLSTKSIDKGFPPLANPERESWVSVKITVRAPHPEAHNGGLGYYF